MMKQPTLEEVRALFSRDRFATENGAVVEAIGDGYARCALTLTERHQNAMGGVMGGASFLLADFAFAVASNWQQPGVVSLSSNISFLGPAKGSRLIAEAHCQKNGRSICHYRVDVADELGNPVAAVTVTGCRVDATAGRASQPTA